jgi:Tfp pilus assembly protein PilF
MAITHVCRNCGTSFTVEEGEKPRCPSCLRVHGVEGGEERESKEPQAPEARGRGWIWGLALLAVAGIGVGLFFGLRQGTGPRKGPEGASVDRALVEALKKQGIPDDELVLPVGETEPLAAQGKEALAVGSGAPEQASALRGVAEALLRPKSLRPGAEDLLGTLLIRSGPKAYEDLRAGREGGVYALELGAMLVSMARAAGASAWAFELGGAGGPRVRAELGPVVGRIGVALYPGRDLNARPAVLDLDRVLVLEGAEGRRLEDAELAAQFYSVRAGHFWRQGEGKRANRESEWAQRLDPLSPAVTATRGIVLLSFGQTDGAISAFKRAAQLGGGGGRFEMLTCLALLRAERPDEALESCKRGVEKDPGVGATHLALGFAYLTQGESDKAKESIEHARKLDDSDPEVHKALAQLYMTREDTPAAKAALEVALRLDPKARGAHLMRGLLAMKELDLEGAAAALRQETVVDPANERVRALLASVLHRAGDKAGAERVISEMRSGSRDREVTDKLIAEIRKEMEEDAEVDDAEKTDGGAPPDGGRVPAGKEEEADDVEAGDGGAVLRLPMPGERRSPKFFDLKK